MGSKFGIVVGVDTVVNNAVSNNGKAPVKNKQATAKVYRVIIATVDKKQEQEGQFDWKFQCKMMNEVQIVQSIQGGASWLNVKLDEHNSNKIKGSSGDLSRFEVDNPNKPRPYVIISQILGSDKKTLLGYKVARYDGNVKSVRLKEMIAYGNRVTKAGAIPVQNAMFMPVNEKTGTKRAYYKAYPGCKMITEVLEKSPENKYTQVDKQKVNLKQNEKTLNKLEEIYTKEQIVELGKGKKSGVPIKIYANPNLSAEQMKALRRGLEKGLNVKPLAFPEYSADLMNYYILDLENGLDIKQYLNPNYNLEQVGELSLAVESGLDISKMANPKLSPVEMSEIRERLSNNIWKEWLVSKDGSWDPNLRKIDNKKSASTSGKTKTAKTKTTKVKSNEHKKEAVNA